MISKKFSSKRAIIRFSIIIQCIITPNNTINTQFHFIWYPTCIRKYWKNVPSTIILSAISSVHVNFINIFTNDFAIYTIIKINAIVRSYDLNQRTEYLRLSKTRFPFFSVSMGYFPSNYSNVIYSYHI